MTINDYKELYRKLLWQLPQPSGDNPIQQKKIIAIVAIIRKLIVDCEVDLTIAEVKWEALWSRINDSWISKGIFKKVSDEMVGLPSESMVDELINNGYTISGSGFLLPPVGHRCRNWAAKWQEMTYKESTIRVPHWWRIK